MSEEELEQRVERLERRMDEGDDERHSLVDMVKTNIELPKRVAHEKQELRRLWTEARTAYRFFSRVGKFVVRAVERLGKTVRWFATIVVMPVAFVFAAFYWITHQGEAPRWFQTLMAIVAGLD